MLDDAAAERDHAEHDREGQADLVDDRIEQQRRRPRRASSTKTALARQWTTHSPDSAIAIRSIAPFAPTFANINSPYLLTAPL